MSEFVTSYEPGPCLCCGATGLYDKWSDGETEPCIYCNGTGYSERNLVVTEIEPESKTLYEDKVSILAELWLSYRDDEEFQDFIQYNDLGLPLAYAIDNGIVESTDLAARFIEETFELLVDGLDIEDTGFETVDEMLAESYDS